jgi:Subtilase family
MGWTRSSGRVARDRRRPCLESLEGRQLLSQLSLDALPAATTAAVNNSDGSTNFDQIIGASAARSTFGVNGAGSNVAVIDTGVNFQNSILGGALGPGDKVVAGVDFTGSPNGVLPTWQHGTGVAGLIAANGSNYQGVAPGAGIVALRVFGDNNQGSFTSIEKALDWVVQNHAQYNITAVNLSISDGGNYQSNEFGQDGGVGQAITTSIGQLDSMNIPVVVAAGNSFNGKTQGQGFPASVPDTISVTATDASDKLASNAQRIGSSGGTAGTTIAAPGVAITAPADGNNLTTEDGTSFAAPQVTGSIVLLQQIYEKAFNKLPTVAQLEGFLQQGAVTIHDNATGLNIGRLDVLNSATILEQQIASIGGTNPGANGNPSSGVSAGSTVGSQAVAPVVAPSLVQAPPVQSPPVQSPPVQSAPIQAPPVQSPTAPVAPPQTEVFYNGVSIGSYSTSQLAAHYSNLFAFLKGPVGSIRVYGPKGSVPNLGASQPSGTAIGSATPSSKAAPKHVKAPAPVKAQSHPVVAPKVTVHKAAVHKKPSSFLSSLFHFPF